MVYGGMTADHDASNSQYALPYELSIGEKGNLLYDGKKDNTLTGTWYLARKDDSDDSSGGCNAGFGALALLAAVAALRKKR